MSEVHPDVISLARNGEPERYVAATLSPLPLRRHLIVIAAFAADLRRIPRVVKEPVMGEVRLQWWRDCIAGFGVGHSTGHPLADALADATRTHQLPTASLVAMTEARAFDLYDDSMPDEAAFQGYLSKTEAIPFALSQIILGGRDKPELCSLAARSFGYLRLLAELPVALSRGRLPIPPTILKKHDIDAAELLTGRAGAELRSLLVQSCHEAIVTYQQLRQALASARHLDRLALLPIAMIPALVSALQRPGRDPCREIADISPLVRVMHLGRARWLGL